MSKNDESQRTKYSIPDISKIDPSKYASLTTTQEPDFITNKGGRDIMGQLVFNTGVLWFGGFVAGGGFGVVDGWRTAASPNMKVRLNSVLNGVSRHGNRLGNALGVLGCYYTLLSWGVDKTGIDTITGTTAATPVVAGFLTGSVYKVTTGVRGSLLAGVLGAVGSCAYFYGSTYLLSKKSGRF